MLPEIRHRRATSISRRAPPDAAAASGVGGRPPTRPRTLPGPAVPTTTMHAMNFTSLRSAAHRLHGGPTPATTRAAAAVLVLALALVAGGCVDLTHRDPPADTTALRAILADPGPGRRLD